MWLTAGAFIFGIILLTIGAELFVRSSSSLAARLRMSPLLIGLTVVAFGTSAPELFVSVKSAIMGAPGIAVGNVIGSNIANIALILGLSSIITPISVKLAVLRRDTPFMIFITGVGCILLLDRSLSRLDSLILLIIFTGYVATTIILANRESKTGIINTKPETSGKKIPGLPINIIMLVTGLSGLIYGSHLLIQKSIILARFLNISETVIGITIVAVGTSLPELAASLTAAIKKETDILLGNIVGSNVFNIGLVLGSGGVILPYSTPELKKLDLLAMFSLSIVLLPFLKSGFKLNRIEGAVLFLCYAAYIYFIWI